MDERTIKTPNPICRQRTLRHVFNRFYRLEIHSLMAGIFDSARELLPPWKKELIKTPNHKCRLYWCLIEVID
jgi:hypothetical protein